MISPCLCVSKSPLFGANISTAVEDYRWRTPSDWVEEANKRYLSHSGQKFAYSGSGFYPRMERLEDVDSNHFERRLLQDNDVPTRDAFVMFGQQAHFSQPVLNQPAVGERFLTGAKNMLFGALQPLPKVKSLHGENAQYKSIPEGDGKLFWWLG
ncbi:MAG: hypothetical protein VKJ04_07545 [Vampirovibrionales bacterium]|nr:hypothetical protein [Vampirovibrionales bacterium]